MQYRRSTIQQHFDLDQFTRPVSLTQDPLALRESRYLKSLGRTRTCLISARCPSQNYRVLLSRYDLILV